MYVRQIDEQTLTLQVSGKLWMRSLVMSDAETGTEWAHLLGRGMAGQLQGRKLKPLITDMVTWQAWKQQHPETTVLNMAPVTPRFTRRYYRSPQKFVFGFEVDGRAMALPMTQMLKHPVHHFEIEGRPLLATFDKQGAGTHLFEARLKDRALSFRSVDELTMRDEQTDSRWSVRDGTCIEGPLKGEALVQRVGIMSFRQAWQNFHPESVDVKFEN